MKFEIFFLKMIDYNQVRQTFASTTIRQKFFKDEWKPTFVVFKFGWFFKDDIIITKASFGLKNNQTKVP